MGDGPNKIPIDKSRHVAQRRAMAEWRERQRVVITRETFGVTHTARVLVDDELYDVGDRDLRLLRAGATPAELELCPVAEDK